MDSFAKILSAVVSAAILLTSCGEGAFVPEEGDLIFVVAQESAMSSAISESTSRGESLSFDHVAMVAVDSTGLPYVIEAAPKGGVKRTEYADFLKNAPLVGGQPGVVVKRLSVEFSAAETVRRAEAHVGEEYDWSYTPDNGRMYCSELVYESYFSKDGGRIFTAVPMSFRNEEGNIPDFWVELFAKLGEEIPEGEPGTNPNDMSEDPALYEVHRYF